MSQFSGSDIDRFLFRLCTAIGTPLSQMEALKAFFREEIRNEPKTMIALNALSQSIRIRSSLDRCKNIRAQPERRMSSKQVEKDEIVSDDKIIVLSRKKFGWKKLSDTNGDMF